MTLNRKIQVNSYVKLKKGFDETDMYRRVDAGATGWVRDRKIDDDGFSMIFIEWDETNPNYAGEVDKWVFENHFEILSDKYDKDKIIERYIEQIKIGTDSALAADAFALITIHKHKSVNGVDIYEPQLHASELDEEARFVLEAQIVYMASRLYQDYIQDTLNSIKHKGKEDESGR
jgi:hypothetical protein